LARLPRGIGAIAKPDQRSRVGQFANHAQDLALATEIKELARQKRIVATSTDPRFEPLPQCHLPLRHTS
jgi:hypothetical protein